MKDNNQHSPKKLLTLQEAAQLLSVPVEVLLQWNEHHILTPTITRTGQIGYTKEQVTHFLAIKESLSQTSPAFLPGEVAQHDNSTPQETSPSLLAAKHSAPLWTVTVAAGVLLVLAVATQQSKMMSLLHLAEQKAQTPENTQTKQSVADLHQAIPLSQTATLAESAGGDHLHSQTSGAFATNIFATPTPTKIPVAQTRISTSNRRALPSSRSAQSKSIQAKQSISSPVASVEAVIADTATLAEKAALPCPSCDTEKETQQGLNLGKAPENAALLAAAFGTGALANDYSQQNLSTVTSQAVVMVFGALAFALLLLRRRRQRLTNQQMVTVAVAQSELERVLEVKQKMDGTVVLCLQGKDYKISKPELDSDSDRFIERLMQLVKPGMKEIEYEGLSDSLDLTTPLSRLVTRLGFVGIKRDLFFPRTSKHRVLFRKYITAADLSAMNLTIEKVRQALALPNQG